MTTKKIYSGLYKVEHKDRRFELENMTEFGQGWQIRNEEGEWLMSFETKGLCQDWIERTI